MRNRYGALLDSNGYAPSIISGECCCFICRNNTYARHEIFRSAFRSKSKEYGLWLNLCPRHHDEVHENGDLDEALRRQAEIKAMTTYGWSIEDFIEEFGKNYLEV